jgi:predicted phosphodiesterase
VKLALISDVHANLEALEATLADISAQAVDRIVCLGDIVGYNSKPAECVALIREPQHLLRRRQSRPCRGRADHD